MKTAVQFFVILLCVSASVFLLKGIQTQDAAMDAARTSLYELNMRTIAIEDDVDKLVRPTQNALAQIAAASKTLAQVGAQERDNFKAQQQYYAQVTVDTSMMLRSANGTIADIDTQILPQVRNLLLSSSADVRNLGDSIVSLSEQSKQMLSDTDTLMVGARKTVDNTAVVTANLASTTERGDRIAEHYERIILAPVSKAKAAALFAASIAGRVLRIF